MGFGMGYTPVEQLVLDDGEYFCCIQRVEEKKYNNGHDFVEVVVNVKNMPGYNPNTFVINTRPEIGTYKSNGEPITDKDCKKWDNQMTKIFDAFGIERGNFNFVSWRGKTGWCRCSPQYDKNEADHKSKQFKQLVPFVKKDESAPVAQKQQIPPQVQQVAKAVGGTVQEFNEDIPF